MLNRCILWLHGLLLSLCPLASATGEMSADDVEVTDAVEREHYRATART